MDKLKQKLTIMKENAFCFVHLIADYVRKAISGRNVSIPLERHLQVCARCAREKEDYEKFLEKTPDLPGTDDDFEGLPASAAFKETFPGSRRAKKNRAIKPGQIWSTPGFPDYLSYRYGLTEKVLPYSLDPRPFLVCSFDPGPGVASGFPLNLEYFEFASDFDLIVPAKESGLGFEFMVETWNPVSTAREFLQDYWGSLPSNTLKKVMTLARQFNGLTAPAPQDDPENLPASRQFQHIEQYITQYISAPLLEKKEFEALESQFAAQKILDSLIVCHVIRMRRHKNFLPLAADKGDKVLHIFSKEHPLFNRDFTLNISVREKDDQFLLQLRIIDNKTGEETRGFVADIMEWTGNFPRSKKILKTAYLIFKKNNTLFTHSRLWEQKERLALPPGKNIVLAIYKADCQERIELFPIQLCPKRK